MNKKPYAQACVKNGPPILGVLRQRLPDHGRVLEIASGTGQHAIYFGKALPGIEWQTSDLKGMHSGMQQWLDEAKLGNVLSPLFLDVMADVWPEKNYDAVFSANSAHIMPTEAVEKMFFGVARVLAQGGLFFLYGPFMYAGKHSSDSNYLFDCWLKSNDPQRGVRDVDWLKKIALTVNVRLLEDVEMPANNRMLVWCVERRYE